ncbi:MAG: ComEC/Rec2 family competence protein [Crocinitomicaceae bacterium]
MDNVNSSFDIALVLMVLAMSIFLIFSASKVDFIQRFRSSLLFIALIALGGMLISEHRTNPKLINKGVSVLLSLDEIASIDKDWRKSICTINSVLTNDSVIEHDEQVVLFFNSTQLQAGDVLLVQTNLERIENKNNPGEFDVKSYWNNKNIYQIGFVGENDFKLIKTVEQPWWKRWGLNIRESMTDKLRKILMGESLGVGVALLLGDKQLLSNEVRSSFSNAGAMHVLAVSGLHVGIVLFILMFVLGKFTRFISKTTAVVISIVIIWIYAGVTGLSPSVLRASFMFSILAIAQISGRSKNPMNVLFFSAFVLLLFQPLWIYDIGFQLSYLAMIGIFVLYDPISKLFYFKNKWITKIWQGTAVGLAAQAFTVPLTLYYFHQFPNYFILTNIGMMVFAGLILGIGLFFFAVSWTTFLAFVAGNILNIGLISMVVFVQWVDSIPFSVAIGFQLSEELLYLIYFLLILAIFKSSKKFKTGIILTLFGIFSQIHFQRYQNMNTNEMVIFNSDDFTMAIKNENQIVCFHTAKKERIEKVKRMLNDYKMGRPGKVSFVYLKEGLFTTKISDEKFELRRDIYGVDIVSSKVKLYVRTSYSGNYFELDKALDMAYLAKNKDRYNLSEGAKTIPLN